MRKISIIVALLVIISSSGWSSAQVKIQHDDFAKSTSVVGVDENKSIGITGFHVQLVASVPDATRIPTYTLLIVHAYNGSWRMYNSAFDADGTPLKVVSLNREPLNCSAYGCTLIEAMGIPLSREYLDRVGPQGIRLKLYGNGYEEIFTYGFQDIKSVLDEVDGRFPRTARSRRK